MILRLERAEKAEKTARYRLHPLDGVLERLVERERLGPAWLPVVPAGQATKIHSWKRWVFLQVHIGPGGAHHNAEDTVMLMTRSCWWEGFEEDCRGWVEASMSWRSPQRVINRSGMASGLT